MVDQFQLWSFLVNAMSAEIFSPKMNYKLYIGLKKQFKRITNSVSTLFC